jgi:TolB protein
MMKPILAVILLSAATVPAPTMPRQARIETGIDVGAKEVRVAFPEFQPRSNDPTLLKYTALFNQVLWEDLDYSGSIALVNRSFYPLGKFQTPTDIRVEEWTKPAVNAQYMVFGASDLSRGQLRFESRLWDLGVVQNRELIAKVYTSSALTDDAVRLTAHTLADEIVDKLFGGRMGIARTQIAYVAATGNNNKEIYLMDYDGSNAGPLTVYRSTTIMPNWAPDGERLAYVTTRRSYWNIEIMSRLDRRTVEFPKPAGTTGTPSWSPDASQVAYSTHTSDATTEIFVADWNGRNPKRLTVTKKGTINISPTWSKTGQQIAFVSDRSGTQQIYTMDAEGTNVQRLIDEGGDAENPTWSPDGQFIAFAWKKRNSGRYDIYVHDLARGRNSQLTSDAGDNERPSWAPDSRHIVFASNRTGRSQIYSMLAGGQNPRLRQLTKTGSNEGPAWSSFIGK